MGITRIANSATARSGRAALKYRLENIGFTLQQDELDTATKISWI